MHLQSWLGTAGLALLLTFPPASLAQDSNGPSIATIIDLPAPFVKVVTERGSGSAVHIGDGIFLTTAHLFVEGDAITLRAEDGSERKASLLWSRADYDIAVVSSASGWLTRIDVACTPLWPGQRVIALGNPMDLESLQFEGRVAGLVTAVSRWSAVSTLDINLLPGMSGGALVDDSGRVVGINVGSMYVGGAFVGIGVAVPGDVLCMLMEEESADPNVTDGDR